jgi:hypothetical protein
VWKIELHKDFIDVNIMIFNENNISLHNYAIILFNSSKAKWLLALISAQIL